MKNAKDPLGLGTAETVDSIFVDARKRVEAISGQGMSVFLFWKRMEHGNVLLMYLHGLAPVNEVIHMMLEATSKAIDAPDVSREERYRIIATELLLDLKTVSEPTTILEKGFRRHVP